MPLRDVVVIGASAGGIEALTALVSALPGDFASTLFVVLHIPPHSPSSLPAILSRSGPLPAVHPEDGEPIQPGRIYVAPPDKHLLIEHDRVVVKRGPKENRARPSVDALFRSAAYVYRSRVIGIVLSGTLDDGTSGLWSVKRLGGLAIVQQPEEAAFPDMPCNALEQVEVDHTLGVHDMGALLSGLVKQSVTEQPHVPLEILKRLELEVQIATDDDAFERGIMEWGELTPFTCPECHGVLVRLYEGKLARFRCHTGHAFTPNALLAEVTEAVEHQLWQAMRGLEECTMLLKHMGEHFQQAGQNDIAALFFTKARDNGERARVVHESLPRHEQLSGDLRRQHEER